MPTTSASDAIRENASCHSRIIAEIAELDYVPSALSSQTACIADLTHELHESNQRLRKLKDTTMKERKEHEALRDSTARRFTHKLFGKREQFEARESKEEREYLEALEKELVERDSERMLRQMLNEAKQVQAGLINRAEQYELLKKELSEMYLRIFNGPTEEFPEDDRLECLAQSSQVYHDQVQKEVNSECKAADLLRRAEDTVAACKAKVKEALGYSQWDMWGGGSISDAMERNSLNAAQSLANQAELLCHQAQNVSPLVKPIGHIGIAHGSLMSDMFFDNIFTDMAFHRKITASAADLEHVHSRLRIERDAAQRRANEAGNRLIEASQTLEHNRLALNNFRREVFQQYERDNGVPCGSFTSSTNPPSYQPVSNSSSSLVTDSIVSPLGPLPSTSTTPLPLQENHNLATGMLPSSALPLTWRSRNPYAAVLASRLQES